MSLGLLIEAFSLSCFICSGERNAALRISVTYETINEVRLIDVNEIESC